MDQVWLKVCVLLPTISAQEFDKELGKLFVIPSHGSEKGIVLFFLTKGGGLASHGEHWDVPFARKASDWRQHIRANWAQKNI